VEDLQPPGHADEPVHPAPADVSEEPDAAQTAAERAEAARRRRPSTVGGAIYLAVLAAAAVGLGIVSQGNWRLGVKWIGVSLVVAAVVRLALPAREAGMLAVRRRLVDVTLLTAVGLFLWFLSTNIPNQPVP
jgi:cation transport ATPase